MNTLKNIYINALLSDAAYVKNLNNLANKTIRENLDKRMTSTQAQFIVDNFEVLAVKETDDWVKSGFDAVIWRGKENGIAAGKVFVSLRGTEGAQDFITDADLALSVAARRQIIDMVNWWNQVVTPVGKEAVQIKEASKTDDDLSQHFEIEKIASVKGLGILNSADEALSITVNGHSLGGHLSGAFARLLQGGVNIEDKYLSP